MNQLLRTLLIWSSFRNFWFILRKRSERKKVISRSCFASLKCTIKVKAFQKIQLTIRLVCLFICSSNLKIHLTPCDQDNASAAASVLLALVTRCILRLKEQTKDSLVTAIVLGIADAFERVLKYCPFDFIEKR